MSWSDCSGCWLLTYSAKNSHVHMNVIEANTFKCEKNITIWQFYFTYWHYRIIASGQMGSIKIKSAGSPTFFPPSLHLPISFSPCSTLEPVWRLLNQYDFLVELLIGIPWVIKFGFYTFKKFWLWQKSSIRWSVHPPLPFRRCEMTNLLAWSPKYKQSVFILILENYVMVNWQPSK